MSKSSKILKQNVLKILKGLFLFCIFPSYIPISYTNQFNHNDIASTLPDEQKLINELLSSYDPVARPVFNASKSVIIDVSLSLIQISDMDERNQIFTSNVWVEQEWFDERLSWNRSKYNKLDKLRIPCNRLWLPDIVLYNSADHYNKGYMQSKVMVKPDGRVFWPLPIKLISSCKIDVTYFPFDDQVCSWKFGSWTYSGLQVDMNNLKESGDLSNYVESGEWHLRTVTSVKHVVYYPCCPNEPYPDITFHILIRRRVLYFLFNIILPCVWLSVLSLIGFWLPPDSGEKITLGITVLLAFSVFMLLVAENIPATSETVPLIVIYFTFSMSMTSLSIIVTVLLHQLHHPRNYAPLMPRRFYFFMTRKAAYAVGMGSTVKRFEAQKQIGKNRINLRCRKAYKNEIVQINNVEVNNSQTNLHQIRKCCNKNDKILKSIKKINNGLKHLLSRESEASNVIANEWKLIGIIMDRLIFWTFFNITICSASFLLIILPVLKHFDLI